MYQVAGELASQSNPMTRGHSRSMSLLLGDVDGDGAVTNADFAIEKADQGQTTDENNFRADIDASGSIDRRDANIVKQQIGTSAP